jgi:MSHA biogenesis protein MshQ
LTANQTSQFTATVTGTSNTAVTWSINPLVGSILNGLYQAPASITVAQAITVTATSVADGSKSASSVVNLAAAGGWYGVGGTWTNRKTITIDHNKVSGGSSLTNFPMLFSVTDANLKTVGSGGSVGRTDGTDILFTAADGVTKLNHEIELYNGATGQLIAWVNIPALSGVADTLLYVYYGNGSAGDQQNKSGVWDGYHQGVWHMAETSGTTLSDATSNGRNAAKLGANNPAPTAGFIGAGQAFAGTANSTNNDYASFAATAASSVYTVEFWVKQTSRVSNDVVVMGGSDIWSSVYFYWYPSSQLQMRDHWNGFDLGTYSAGVWHHFAVVRNGDSVSSYIDGALAVSAAGGGTNAESFSQMGFAGANGSWNSLNGQLDELRISNTARPAAWIGAGYNNQNSPSTFYSVGGQQSGSAGARR